LLVTEPAWARCFGLWDEADERLIGHVDLSGGRLTSEMHRCELGIGNEAAWCGRGLGPRLMRTAIEFARAQPTLAWLDLHVLSSNQRAFRLYQRWGFSETGFVRDRFRIAGESVADIGMSYKLG